MNGKATRITHVIKVATRDVAVAAALATVGTTLATGVAGAAEGSQGLPSRTDGSSSSQSVFEATNRWLDTSQQFGATVGLNSPGIKAPEFGDFQARLTKAQRLMDAGYSEEANSLLEGLLKDIKVFAKTELTSALNQQLEKYSADADPQGVALFAQLKMDSNLIQTALEREDLPLLQTFLAQFSNHLDQIQDHATADSLKDLAAFLSLVAVFAGAAALGGAAMVGLNKLTGIKTVDWNEL